PSARRAFANIQLHLQLPLELEICPRGDAGHVRRCLSGGLTSVYSPAVLSFEAKVFVLSVRKEGLFQNMSNIGRQDRLRRWRDASAWVIRASHQRLPGFRTVEARRIMARGQKENGQRGIGGRFGPIHGPSAHPDSAVSRLRRDGRERSRR